MDAKDKIRIGFLLGPIVAYLDYCALAGSLDRSITRGIATFASVAAYATVEYLLKPKDEEEISIYLRPEDLYSLKKKFPNGQKDMYELTTTNPKQSIYEQTKENA